MKALAFLGDRARVKRVVGPLFLVTGLGLGFLTMRPEVPAERHVAFQLAETSTITAVSVTWERQAADRRNAPLPMRGSTWQFSPGSAPKVLTENTSLVDGAYTVSITVERGDRRDTSQRVVMLEGADHVAIPVR